MKLGLTVLNRVAAIYAPTVMCVLTFVARVAWAYSAGITGYSGDPQGFNHGQFCSECHSGGVLPSVRFDGVPSTVAAGTTATFSFVVHSNSPTKQIAAGLDVSVDQGFLAIVAGQGERFFQGEVTHTSPKPNDANGDASWDLTFIAPSSPVKVTLYGAGNSVNLNGASTGDRAAKTSISFQVVAARPSPTATPTPTITPAASPTVPFTAAPSITPTPTTIATNSPTETVTTGVMPTTTPFPTETATTGPIPTSTPSPTATPQPSIIATASATETATAAMTPTPPPAPVCIGDCDGTGKVTVDDLVKGVNIALGKDLLPTCPAFDCNGNGNVTVDCLVKAVNNALFGCDGKVGDARTELAQVW